MNQIISSRPRRFRLLRPLLAAAIGFAAIAAIGTPASAREWDHGRDWRHHEWRHEDWRWHRPVFSFGAFAPAPVYVPPPAPVYVPEPSYYAPSYVPAPVYAPPAAASFNLVVPLRFH